MYNIYVIVLITLAPSYTCSHLTKRFYAIYVVIECT